MTSVQETMILTIHLLLPTIWKA